MTKQKSDENLEIFNLFVSRLSGFEPNEQAHILESVIKWLQLSDLMAGTTSTVAHTLRVGEAAPGNGDAQFNDSAEISAKQFMIEKDPTTNVERIACLAFYATHFRDTPHFKTLDLSRLNTEAAQPKFSNPSMAVNDAAKSGLLVSAGKGNKQLSGMGEQFVQALPNRENAKAIMSTRKKPRRKKTAKSGK